MKRIIGILCAVCIIGAVYADDVRKPAMQIEDNSFFDPTRKVEHEEAYRFRVDYRLEAGYVQPWQRTENITYPDLYLHGVRLGGTFDFVLPRHFSVQTGLFYTLTYGRNEQHWRSVDAPSVQTEYIRHRVLSHNLTIPVQAYYTIPLWKELNLFFFTGPQLHIGLAQSDYLQTHLSVGMEAWLRGQGIATEPYDRYAEDLIRANIQWGVGGGLEWAQYRLQAGYDFGLNNLVRTPQVTGQHMSEWGWFVSFCYKL